MPSSSLELLEARIAPAHALLVTYQASTGALTLAAADDDTHHVTIYRTGPATWRVESLGDTILNPSGAAFLDFSGKLSSVSFTGGADADELQLVGLRPLTDLTFNGGTGDNALSTRDLSVTRNVTVNLGSDGGTATFSGGATTIGGDFLADFGGGGTIRFDSVVNTIRGGARLNAGPGSDELFMQGSSTNIGRGLSFGSGDAGSGTPGFDVVSLGSSLSTVLGKNSQGFSLFFRGGQDGDTLESIGSGSLVLSGLLQYDGGSGQNTFQIQQNSLQGTNMTLTSGGDEDTFSLQVRSLQLSGALYVDGDKGTNTLDFSLGQALIVGKTSLLGGSEDDTIRLRGLGVTLRGGLSVEAGAGENHVTLGLRSLTVAGDLSLQGGVDNDTFTLAAGAVQVSGQTSLLPGAGLNSVLWEATTAVYSRNFSLTALGAAQNSLTLRGGSATVKGNLSLEAEADLNEINLQWTSLSVGGALNLTGGSAVDVVNARIETLSILGPTSINLQGGINQVELGTFLATLTGNFTYTGGLGDDGFHFFGTTLNLRGAVQASMGDGFNNFDLSHAHLSLGRTLTLLGGSSDDTLHLGAGDLLIRGAVLLDGGDGGNELDLSATTLQLSAPLTLQGGGNEDTLRLSAHTLAASAGLALNGSGGENTMEVMADLLTLKAGLSFTGGGSTNTARLFADGTIAGALTVDLGAGSSSRQTTDLHTRSGLPGNLRVGGALSLRSLAGPTDGLLPNLVTVTDLTVTNTVALTLGEGGSDVVLDNLTARDNFTLVAGAGLDVVSIEQGRQFGPSTFAKLTSIDLGAGNDFLNLGRSSAPGSEARIRFLGDITLEGGEGTNSLTDLQSRNYLAPGVKVTVHNFTT